MKKNIVILAVILISATFDIFGQVKELQRAEFFSKINAAEQKKNDYSRREIKKLQIYSKGILESTQDEIEEFLKPDKQRYLSTEKSSHKTQKLELIKIGTEFFQRKDTGEWTKEKTWGRGDSMMGIPIPKTSSHTVEKVVFNNRPVQLYRFFAIYDEYKPEEGEEAQTYWEQKTWIDEKGFEIREEIIVGKPQSKEIRSHRIYEYEYDSNIKIEAPIIKRSSYKRKTSN